MIRILKITLLLLLMAAADLCRAQDIHFSQFFDAPLLRNPSLAGLYAGDFRVQTVHRNQWNNITQAYKTTSLNAESKFALGKSNDYITAGVQVLYDQAGSAGMRTIHALPAINFHKSIDPYYNSYVSMGMMFGMVQRSIDLTKMTTNSQYEGAGLGENITNPSYRYFDASAGICFSSSMNNNHESNFFVGLAYHHFNQPQASFYGNEKVRVQPKWVASGGLRLSRDGDAYINIQADVSVQGTSKMIVGGLMYGKQLDPYAPDPRYKLHGGIFYRLNDAVIPTAKLDFLPFSVTMSYDINISSLKQSTLGMGGFEVAVSYVAFRKRNSSREAVMCPLF